MARQSKVLQAFDSVSAAFHEVFTHHIGTDPMLELKVIKAILQRENCLSKVTSIVARIKHGIALFDSLASRLNNPGHEYTYDHVLRGHHSLVDCLSTLRDASINAVEAVLKWRADLSISPPPAFYWEGRNYLIKIQHDLDILAEVEPLLKAMHLTQDKVLSNPFMLSNDLRRKAQAGEDLQMGPAEAPENEATRRVIALAQALTMEETYELDRPPPPSRTTEIPPLFAMHSDTRSPSDATTTHSENRASLLRPSFLTQSELNMLNWHAQAQEQLQQLKTSMREGQVKLRELSNLSPDPDKTTAQRGSCRMSCVDKATIFVGPLQQELSWPPERQDGALMQRPSHRSICKDQVRQSVRQLSTPKYLERVTSRYRYSMQPNESADNGSQNSQADHEQSRHAHRAAAASHRSSEDSLSSINERPRVTFGLPSKPGKPAGAYFPHPAGQYSRKRQLPSKKPAADAALAPEAIARLIDEEDIARLREGNKPSRILAILAAACLILLAPEDAVPTDVTWPVFKLRLQSGSFLQDLVAFSSRANQIPSFKLRALQSVFVVGMEKKISELTDTDPGAAKLGIWILHILLLQREFVTAMQDRTAVLRAIVRIVFAKFAKQGNY